MYGQEHPLPFKTGEGEKYLLGLTLPQSLWLGLGLYLANLMAKVIPPLPVSWFVFRYVHYGIPIGVCAVFAFVAEPKTGLPFYLYFYYYVAQRLRPRKLT